MRVADRPMTDESAASSVGWPSCRAQRPSNPASSVLGQPGWPHPHDKAAAPRRKRRPTEAGRYREARSRATSRRGRDPTYRVLRPEAGVGVSRRVSMARRARNGDRKDVAERGASASARMYQLRSPATYRISCPRCSVEGRGASLASMRVASRAVRGAPHCEQRFSMSPLSNGGRRRNAARQTRGCIGWSWPPSWGVYSVHPIDVVHFAHVFDWRTGLRRGLNPVRPDYPSP